MKILNIIQCTNLGGMEQASLRLMQGLQSRGHEFELISLNPLGGLLPALQESSIPSRGLDYKDPGGWGSFFDLKKRMKQSEADGLLMTGHNLMAATALGRYCKKKRVLAIHFHHTGVKPYWQWKLIYKQAMKQFQAITFPSDFIRLEAEAIHPPIARISLTIRNPLADRSVITPKERRSARETFGLPLSVPLIGNAGWLIPRKRFDIFLQVSALVAREIPDACFVIAGDGADRVTLQKLAEDLGIAERVYWLGWQQDIWNFYAALDVLLFNSDWDALGMTPLEAMSIGLPVVCSVLNGGLKEIMHDDSVGKLLDSHNVEELANELVRTIRNPEDGRRAAGRTRLLEICSEEKTVGAYERLFYEL